MARRTVSEVAALTGVTVRTLHHYDQIGLLPPAERSGAGYRLYDDADVARLHDIVTWRALGFPLDEVRALLDDPGHDPAEALALHRQRLIEEAGELHQRIAALDAAIRKLSEDRPLDDADLAALFDGFDPSAYEEEVERRWGDTEAFREAQRRTRAYTEAQWQALKADAADVNARLAELLGRGIAPASSEAKLAAEAHRAHMSRWFYECTPEIHQGLADLYEADPRFRKTYEAVAPGLTDFLVAAIRALHAPAERAL